MRKVSIWVAALAAAASVAATAPRALAADVKIGVLFPLTGNAAAAGQASKAAVEVAAEIINGKHPELANMPLAAEAGLPELGGAKLELVFVDHQGNPSVAQQPGAAADHARTRSHVLFGAYQSSCTLTATAVGERYGIPFMVGEFGRAQHHRPRLQMDLSRHADRERLCRDLYAFLRRHEEGRARRSIRSRSSTRTPTTAPRSPTRSRRRRRSPASTVALRIPYSANATDVVRAGAAAQGEESGCR